MITATKSVTNPSISNGPNQKDHDAKPTATKATSSTISTKTPTTSYLITYYLFKIRSLHCSLSTTRSKN